MCLLQHFPDAPHCFKENRVGVLEARNRRIFEM
jgi:hypothetical protein